MLRGAFSFSVRTLIGESSTVGSKEQAMPSLLLKISLALTLTATFVALGATPTIAQGGPNLSSLDAETRQSIELACLMEKIEGPAAYGRCLNAQLNSIGVQPSDPARAPSTDPSLAAPRTRPLIPPKRPPIKQPPITSQEAPLRPTQPLHSPPLAWAGVKKPTMPSKLRTGSSSPDVLFSSVEKSVYVLISAPSEHSLRTKSNVSQGSAVAVTSGIALTNCHVLEETSFTSWSRTRWSSQS
jgi:hypothetical protein